MISLFLSRKACSTFIGTPQDFEFAVSPEDMFPWGQYIIDRLQTCKMALSFIIMEKNESTFNTKWYMAVNNTY